MLNLVRKKTPKDFRKILKDSSYMLLGTITYSVLSLILSFILTRFVTKIEYGEFGILKQTLNTFIVFSSFGLGVTATKFISEYYRTNTLKTRKIISLIIVSSFIIGIIISLITFIFSNNIALSLNAIKLSPQIKLCALILFISTLNAIATGILIGFENYRNVGINVLYSAIITFILQILGAYYFKVDGILIGLGSYYFFQLLLNTLTFFKRIPKKYRRFKINISLKEESQILLKFSLPAVLSGILVNPVIWVCQSMLVNEENGYKEMAEFSIANQWRMSVLLIPGVLSQLVLPLLSKESGNSEKYKTMFYTNLKLNIFITGILVGIMILISPFILTFYDKSYNDIYLPLVILLITAAFISINNVLGQAIASKGKMWYGLLFNLTWALVIVGFTYYFVIELKLGSIGLAYSYLIAYVAHTIVQFSFFFKKV